MENVILVLQDGSLTLMDTLVLMNAKMDIIQILIVRNVKHVMIHAVLVMEQAAQNVSPVVVITINLEPNVYKLVQKEHGLTLPPIFANLVTQLALLVLVEKLVVVLLVPTHFS